MSGLIEESSFSPGCSDVQLPEPQIIPAQHQIHQGHKPQLYFAFVIWSAPQRAVTHPVSKPAGPWIWTQCKADRRVTLRVMWTFHASETGRTSTKVVDALKCPVSPPTFESSGSFGIIGSENCPIVAPLLHWWCGLASKMEKNLEYGGTNAPWWSVLTSLHPEKDA